MQPRRRRPWLAALLNLLVPGFGHLYIGRAVRFFVPLALAVGTYLVLGTFGLLSSFAGFTVAFALLLALFFFTVIDAFVLALRTHSYARKWYSRWYIYVPWFLVLVVVSIAWPASRASLFGYAIYRVPGVAMSPTIAHGEYILVDTHVYRTALPSPGEVVVMRLPETGIEYVRRVARRAPDSEVEFTTDNPAASSTGPGLRALPASVVGGKVTYILFSADVYRVGKRID